MTTTRRSIRRTLPLNCCCRYVVVTQETHWVVLLKLIWAMIRGLPLGCIKYTHPWKYRCPPVGWSSSTRVPWICFAPSTSASKLLNGILLVVDNFHERFITHKLSLVDTCSSDRSASNVFISLSGPPSKGKSNAERMSSLPWSTHLPSGSQEFSWPAHILKRSEYRLAP